MMERNAYAPPLAPVEDPSPDAVVEKPRQTVIAVWLLWASLALSVITGTPDLIRVSQGMASFVPILIFGILLAVLVWLFLMISRGRNWARIIWIGVCILGTLVELLTLSRGRMQGGSSIATTVLKDALQWAIVFLLLMRPSREWFRQRGRDRR